MFKPHALKLIQHGRKDFDGVEKYSASPAEFLKFLDEAGIERAGTHQLRQPGSDRFPARSERLDCELLRS